MGTLIEHTAKTKIEDFELLFHAEIEVPYHGILKNNRKIKMTGSGTPTLAKTARQASMQAKLIQELFVRKKKAGLYEPIRCPVWAVFIFEFDKSEFYTKKGAVKKTMPDLSNLYQMPEDCLEKAGVIVNDGQIWAHDLSRRRPGPKTALHIWLYRYTGPLT